MKAIKKPIEIEFYPCERQYFQDIIKWATKERPILRTMATYFELEIFTLEGVHKTTEKDIIIKGIDGEVYPCKKSIFEKTYNIL